jgi:putative membrane protein
MLVRPSRKAGTLLHIHGSAIAEIWPQLLALTTIATIITWNFEVWGLAKYSLTTIPFSLVGLALSIFLGFRNNACYDRWWEARKMWGALINTTRSLTRQLLTLVEPGPDRDELVRQVIGYTYALKYHLRTETKLDLVAPWFPASVSARFETSTNVPYLVLQHMGDTYRAAWKAGRIDPFHLPVLEGSLTTLTDIQGKCERIKNTPVPLSYTMLTHRLVAMYCLALPFGIVAEVGTLTPLVVAIVGYAFIGLDSVGTQLEDPFELDPNDLPLAALARTIERDLLERIDATDIPPPVAPVRGILE